MGTLASLSKSATLTGLHIAEMAVLLFGFAFLMGWIAEEFTKSENWKKFQRLFVVIAIVGVAGEWIADLGVFELTEHLQNIDGREIAEINREAAQLAKDSASARVQIATANQRAADAERDAAVATERAAQAESHLAEANARAAQANTKAEGFRLSIADANSRAAAANERAANAEGRAVRLLRAFTFPRLYIDPEGFSEEFLKLRKFAGTPFLAQGLPPTTLNDTARHDAFIDSSSASNSFGMLAAVGWKRWKPPSNCQPMEVPGNVYCEMLLPSIADGIVVWSWFPDLRDREFVRSPFEMPLDTPERKAWAAAEALTMYLSSQGIQAVDHRAITLGPRFKPAEICPGVLFPKDLILITIGSKRPVDFRWFEQEEEYREREEINATTLPPPIRAAGPRIPTSPR